MATVFLSGSRRIGRLNDDIRRRLGNIVRQEMSIVIGDCNGADRAFQADLARIRYPNVKVFCSGRHCRNNLGGWHVEHVFVPKSAAPRDFYARKDARMAAVADFGFVLWNGESRGSLGNIIRLLNLGRKTLVYLAPERRLFPLARMSDMDRLLEACGRKRNGIEQPQPRRLLSHSGISLAA